MIALREAYNAGLLGRQHWLNNLVAGLVVGIVALPLAMAFAIASGAKPEQGIYTAIIAAFIVSVFGGSRLQIAGPTGAFIVVLSGITAQYGIVGLQIATFMAGLILLALGLTKMGGIIKFIPAPVIVGFTAGIGVIIWVGQWRDFFGLPEAGGEYFHEKLLHLIYALPQFHLPTTLLAFASLGLVIFTPRIPRMKRVPGPLVALVFATVAQSVFHFDGVRTIGSAFGGIPQGLPMLHFPVPEWSQIIELIGPAFTIAMLGAIESLLSAVVADGMAGTRHDSNQELVGQGIANLFTPLFGGFAATGAIARTATNIRNGGNSPIAGIVHSITLVVILATFHFLRRMASSVEVSQATSGEINRELSRLGEKNIPDSTLVFTVEGPFFFGAMENFERALANTHTDPEFLIIRLKWVPFIDVTGLQTLEEVIQALHKREVTVLLSGANSRVDGKLRKAGIVALIGQEHYFPTFDQSVKYIAELGG